MPLLLTERDVRSVLTLSDLIATMETALRRFSAGEVEQPVRTVVTVKAGSAFLGVMPASLSHPAALGAKLVAVFVDNAARGLPTHLATIVLLDPETGALRAIMDGRYITESRTAAVSAVTARHLARPEAAVLAIIGSGVQARSHLEALVHVRPIRHVRVWSPDPAHRAAFVHTMTRRVEAAIVATSTADEAVRGADLVVLATSSTRPVIESAWVAPGAHVMSIGACRPDHREMDPALVARGRLVVDSRAGALVEAGDIVMSIAEGRFTADHIVAEIGEIVMGPTPRRRSGEEITIFKSLGMAVEDLAAADFVWRRSVERGIGTEIQI